MATFTPESPDQPVTVVISRRVKPGCEEAFELFLTGVTEACSQFPGYLGSSIFRPANADDPEYRVIFKFDRLSHLRQWERSPERQHWFSQAARLTESPPQIQVLTGLETWFTLPGKAELVPPPRYKMVVVTWLAVFPLITLLSTILQPYITDVPLVLRVMLITAIAVPVMTYGLMPQMTRLFAGWLYPATADLLMDQSVPSTEQVIDQATVTPLALQSTVDQPLPMLSAPAKEREPVADWSQVR